MCVEQRHGGSVPVPAVIVDELYHGVEFCRVAPHAFVPGNARDAVAHDCSGRAGLVKKSSERRVKD